MVDNYLDNVEAYLDHTKLTDPITGEEVPPDEKLMRSLEQKVQVPEHGKDSFRNEIFRKVAMAHRHGEKFDYTTHEKLKEAIEKQLFEERRDTIKLTISARSPDTEQVRKLKAAALQPSPATGSDSFHQRSKVLSLALGGAALGLAGSALGFELWARSTYDKSKHEPDDARQDSLWHSANTRRYVAEGLGVAGIACAGVAVWLYLRGGEREARHAR